MLLPFGGKVPRDEGAVFVAPNATVLGDVVLGPGSSVWYGAVLRGDDGTLTLGENTNVQDNAVLHCDPGGAVTLGKNVTVGHCALVHGCTVGDGSLIGMHATLLNHCVVGKNCIIGAGALVPEGKIIPDDSLVVGVPGKIIKQVSHQTPNEWIDTYVTLELRNLLKNTSKSIKQITDDLHFANQSFLGKYFKEHVGMSPSEYRKSSN